MQMPLALMSGHTSPSVPRLPGVRVESEDVAQDEDGDLATGRNVRPTKAKEMGSGYL